MTCVRAHVHIHMRVCSYETFFIETVLVASASCLFATGISNSSLVLKLYKIIQLSLILDKRLEVK
jgi:hypothetical protein